MGTQSAKFCLFDSGMRFTSDNTTYADNFVENIKNIHVTAALSEFSKIGLIFGFEAPFENITGNEPIYPPEEGTKYSELSESSGLNDIMLFTLKDLEDSPVGYMTLNPASNNENIDNSINIVHTINSSAASNMLSESSYAMLQLNRDLTSTRTQNLGWNFYKNFGKTLDTNEYCYKTDTDEYKIIPLEKLQDLKTNDKIGFFAHYGYTLKGYSDGQTIHYPLSDLRLYVLMLSLFDSESNTTPMLALKSIEIEMQENWQSY